MVASVNADDEESAFVARRTRRGDHVRIISVRRSRDEEVTMVDSLDREARRLGVTRQSLIKL